jgi:hypothetical protein
MKWKTGLLSYYSSSNRNYHHHQQMPLQVLATLEKIANGSGSSDMVIVEHTTNSKELTTVYMHVALRCTVSVMQVDSQCLFWGSLHHRCLFTMEKADNHSSS